MIIKLVQMLLLYMLQMILTAPHKKYSNYVGCRMHPLKGMSWVLWPASIHEYKFHHLRMSWINSTIREFSSRKLFRNACCWRHGDARALMMGTMNGQAHRHLHGRLQGPQVVILHKKPLIQFFMFLKNKLFLKILV